jgi:hypothetical protein
VQCHALPIAGGIAKIITLEEKDESRLPSMVYFVDGVEFLGTSELLSGQRIDIYPENFNQLTGEVINIQSLRKRVKLSYNTFPGPSEEQLTLLKDVEVINSNIKLTSSNCDFLIVKLDEKHVKPSALTGEVSLKERFVLVMMNGMDESAQAESDLESVL